MALEDLSRYSETEMSSAVVLGKEEIDKLLNSSDRFISLAVAKLAIYSREKLRGADEFVPILSVSLDLRFKPVKLVRDFGRYYTRLRATIWVESQVVRDRLEDALDGAFLEIKWTANFPNSRMKLHKR